MQPVAKPFLIVAVAVVGELSLVEINSEHAFYPQNSCYIAVGILTLNLDTSVKSKEWKPQLQRHTYDDGCTGGWLLHDEYLSLQVRMKAHRTYTRVAKGL
jgi:hypothetical protein